MICEYIDPKKKGHISYLCDSCGVKEIQAEKKTPRKISRNIEKPRDRSPDPCYIKFMKYSTERAESSSPFLVSSPLDDLCIDVWISVMII